jgi:hypothetical protein
MVFDAAGSSRGQHFVQNEEETPNMEENGIANLLIYFTIQFTKLMTRNIFFHCRRRKKGQIHN